jgi:CHAT domain-containing protein/tetratricopeptide (TPR) repeat protein
MALMARLSWALLMGSVVQAAAFTAQSAPAYASAPTWSCSGAGNRVTPALRSYATRVYGEALERSMRTFPSVDYTTELAVDNAGLQCIREEHGSISAVAAETGSIAVIEERLGRYGAALRDELRERTLWRQIRNADGEGLADVDIANTYADLGEYARALNFYRDGIALFATPQSHDVAASAQALGYVAAAEERLGRYRAALVSVRQAYATLRHADVCACMQRTLDTMGLIQTDMGDREGALESYRSALAAEEREGDFQDEAATLTAIASLDAQLRSYRAATIAARRAIAFDTRLGAPTWQALAAAALSEERLGQVQPATRDYDDAINDIEHVRTATAGSTRTSFFATTLYVYDTYIDYLLALDRKFPGRGYARKALEIFERRQGRAFLEEIARSSVQRFARIPADIVNETASLAGELQALRASLADAESNEQTQPAAIASLQRNLASLVAQQSALDARIRTSYPAYYALLHPHPADVAAIEKTLLPSETMLVYDVLADRTALWIVTHRHLSYVPINIGRRRIADQVSAFLVSGPQRLERVIDGSNPTIETVETTARNGRSRFVESSAALYNTVLPPVAQRQIYRQPELFVVPTGPLYRLPFEALVTSGENATPHYLVQDHAISYLSSGSLLVVLRSQPRTGAPQTIVAFANPNFSGSPTQDNGASIPAMLGAVLLPLVPRAASHGTFPDLPDSATEAHRVAAALHAPLALYQQDDASVQTLESLNLQGGLARFRYVLFATHAVMPDQVAGVTQPAIVLSHPASGGFLRMSDVFALSLHANLVTLSACDSGGGTLTAGEGVQGLTQAFMYAGSPAVSVTQWEVVDPWAGNFTPDFFSHIYGGATPARALQLAKLDMLRNAVQLPDTSMRALEAYPFFWASTVIFGDGDAEPREARPQYLFWFVWPLALVLFASFALYLKARRSAKRYQ